MLVWMDDLMEAVNDDILDMMPDKELDKYLDWENSLVHMLKMVHMVDMV
jgi:hypothetical protein